MEKIRKPFRRNQTNSFKAKFKSIRKNQNIPKTRKEVRKEKRKEKKIEKHVFLLRRFGRTPEPPPKKKRRQKKRKKNDTRIKNEIHNRDQDEETEGDSDNDVSLQKTLKEDEEKLHMEMEEVRKKRLVEDNEAEDRNIRSLHKRLKLNKKSAMPASFRVDGLDYLLDFCNNLDKKKLPEPDSDSGTLAKESNDISFERKNSCDDEDESISSHSEMDEGSNIGTEDEDITDTEGGNEEAEESTETNENEELSNEKEDRSYWEDIYGRTRDMDGNVVTGKTETRNVQMTQASPYVPPMRRNQGQRDKINKALKGLLNRLSESNMHSIATQVEHLYMRNSRNEMNESLLEMMVAVLVGPVLSSDRIILEHVMLVAILHANVGTEVGAYFIQNSVQRFHRLYQEMSVTEENPKHLENLILTISYMYHFKIIDCCLIYDILKFLGQSFGDKDVELILVVLRSVGFRLRKDDPLSMKSFIIMLQQKAGEAKKESSSRVKFMLEILLAIRNNNMSKIANYDPTFGEHLLKIVKTFIQKGNYVSTLKISMHDLLNADTKGKWWIVGSPWMTATTDASKSEVEPTPIENSSGSKGNKKLLAKAKKLGMNTDIRRNIFLILMTAEDYVDAFEKLLRLGLKNQLGREIIQVLVYCCLHEKKFNPFYAFLASKFCEADRQNLLTLQYTLWDRLKEFPHQEPHQVNNITSLLIHLINDRSLPITVLKVIDFVDMSSSKLAFLKEVLAGVLLQKSTDNLEEIFIKPGLSDKLHLFRESIKLFMNHFMLNESNIPKSAEAEKVAPVFTNPKIKALLQERIKLAETAMSLGCSKVQL